MEEGSFALCSQPWEEAATLQSVRHVEADEQGAWLLLKVLRERAVMGSEAVAARVEATLRYDASGEAALSLWEQVEPTLARELAASPARYVLPERSRLSWYLLRLEQLLAMRCAAGNEGGSYTLLGERDILQVGVELAAAQPQSLPARLILHQTMRHLQRLRPAITEDFFKSVLLLQQRHAFADPEVDAAMQEQIDRLAPTPA